VRDCVFINDRGGNATEIGYELRCDHVRNITFRNCDVLSVHGHGAPFAIHNGDHATVSDVLYEDIRVEHYYDKIIDFRVLHSQWNRDDERGQIRNISLRNIKIMPAIYNEGYTISVIGGYDAEHTVENIVLEEFYLGRAESHGLRSARSLPQARFRHRISLAESSTRWVGFFQAERIGRNSRDETVSRSASKSA
jgi:hypothetical protein